MQAQGFDLATATKWTSELLVDFCDVANFDLGFVPDAALLIPPEQNVYVDHHDLIDEPKSSADVLGDADSEQVTVRGSSLLPLSDGRPLASLPCAPRRPPPHV